MWQSILLLLEMYVIVGTYLDIFVFEVGSLKTELEVRISCLKAHVSHKVKEQYWKKSAVVSSWHQATGVLLNIVYSSAVHLVFVWYFKFWLLQAFQRNVLNCKKILVSIGSNRLLILSSDWENWECGQIIYIKTCHLLMNCPGFSWDNQTWQIRLWSQSCEAQVNWNVDNNVDSNVTMLTVV